MRGRAALAALLALVAVLLPGTAPARAQEDPEAPVRVLLTRIEPRAPQDGDTVVLAGQLTNTGRVPVEDLRVRMRVGPRPLISRSALARADEEGAVTVRVPGALLDLDAPLAPGATAPFEVRAPVEDLGLDRDGVYALSAEVQGTVADGGGRGTVGLAETFVPWFEEPVTGTTRIAWLWPLTAPPAQAPRLTPRGPVLLDDDLAGSLARDGRLEELLRAARGAEAGQCDPPRAAAATPQAPCRGEPVPVTYAADPDLLLTARGMSFEYDVRRSEERTGPGTGTAAARTWLDELRASLADGPGNELLALPYADVDVPSLAGTPLAQDVALAAEEGARTAQEVTGVAPVPGLGWAPPGPVPPDALAAYRLAGVRSLVVDEAALPGRPPTQSRTSTARAPLRTASGRLDGLVVDEGLSRLLLAPDPASREPWRGPRAAEQRFLVETAIIAAEAPEATRTLVVAPPRDAEVVPAVAAQAMLDTGRLPWLCPVRLSEAAAGTERCPDPDAPGGAAPAEPEDRGAPLAADDDVLRLADEQVEAVTATRVRIDQLTLDVLAPSDEVEQTRVRLLRGAFRAESTAWREAPRQGRLVAALLADDVADLVGRVRVLTGPVTLTSSRGTLLLTVENTLDQAVDVRVRLSAPNEARLGTVVSDVHSVPGRSSVQVRVEAEPRTSGQFPVRARLLDRDGDPFGEPSSFVLRSTRYGAVALAVTGVAAGVLLVAAGVRIVRRALGGDSGAFGRRRRGSGA